MDAADKKITLFVGLTYFGAMAVAIGNAMCHWRSKHFLYAGDIIVTACVVLMNFFNAYRSPSAPAPEDSLRWRQVSSGSFVALVVALMMALSFAELLRRAP